MYETIKFLVDNGLPLFITESKSYRAQSRHTYKFSRQTLRETMNMLVKIVEKQKSFEMKETRGGIMYDGWTKQGTHFVGSYAFYMRNVPEKGYGSVLQQKELAMPLISLSPMA